LSEPCQSPQRAVDPARAAQTEADRGRFARVPRDISAKGWWDTLWRVKDQIAADNVSIVAGGLALFGMLSVFPSLAASVAIYGLIGSPEAIAQQAQAFSGMLPGGDLQIIQSQL
jgi:membrane protein